MSARNLQNSKNETVNFQKPLLFSDGEDSLDRSYSDISSSSSLLQFDNAGGAQLGTFMGVFVPCMLSIFGVVLFLQLGIAVGQAGLIATLVIFGIAELIVLVTTLSLSAIATNGVIKGGGAYFMIARSLGPEFGGSVGLLFYLANSVGACFYAVGFATELCSPLGLGLSLVENEQWNVSIVASLALFVCFAVAFVGADFFAKISLLIFLAVVGPIFLVVLSFLVQKPGLFEGYTGMSGSTLETNLWPEFTGEYSVQATFAILFPAVTGIMAGANMSGDLQNPGLSIPKGTLYALSVSGVVYTIICVLLAATVKREYLADPDNQLVLQTLVFHPAIVATGIVASTISSALGAIVGGARVLQALARDDLIPILHPFAKGSGSADEPRRAVVLTYLVAQCAVFMGDLATISGIISNFFLLSYGITNLACFTLRITSAPNFRPTFKYFSADTALIGFLSCIGVMFYTDWVYAACSVLCMLIVWFYVHLKAINTPWGDVSQAIIYHQVRKYLLRLDARKSHVKFWRPQVLLLMGDGNQTLSLMRFCNNMKKGGLYVIGDVFTPPIIGARGYLLDKVVGTMQNVIAVNKLKAFPEVASGTVRGGLVNLMLMSGLGGMKPNIVVLGLPTRTIQHSGQSRKISIENSGHKEISRSQEHQFVSFSDAGDHEVQHYSQQRHQLREHAKKLFATDTRKAAHRRALGMGLTDAPDPMLKDMRAIFNSTIRCCRDRGKPTLSTTAKEAIKNLDALKELDDLLSMGVTSGELELPGEEFVGILLDALTFDKHVLIARNFEKLPKIIADTFYDGSGGKKTQKGKQFLDLWSLSSDGWKMAERGGGIAFSDSLVLQLGYITNRSGFWRDHTVLRVVSMVKRESAIQIEKDRLHDLLRSARISALVEVIALESQLSIEELADVVGTMRGGRMSRFEADPNVKDVGEVFDTINQHQQLAVHNFIMMRHCSGKTGLIMTAIPSLPAEAFNALPGHRGRMAHLFEKKMPPLPTAAVSGSPTSTASAGGGQQSIVDDDGGEDYSNACVAFMERLEIVSRNLPPIMMCMGVSDVLSTDL